MQIRQRQKRNKKYSRARENALQKDNLLIGEENRIISLAGTLSTGRTLTRINAIHETDFKMEVRELKKRFSKERIQVLDEGGGFSTFATDIKTLDIDVIKTDISTLPYLPYLEQVSVHELAKHYGKNRFHLIVSTYGGVNYSTKPENALSNIWAVLKPGGKAFIVVYPKRKIIHAVAKLGITFKQTKNGIIIFK